MTPANAAAIATAQQELDRTIQAHHDALAHLRQVTAQAELADKLRHPYEDDPAVVSGIRRKPSPRAEARRQAAYRREAEMWEQVRDAQAKVDALEAKEARLRRQLPVPFTEDELAAATHVRDRHGWNEVVRVNAKSVTVRTPWSLTERIPREWILEVRT